MGTSNFVIVVMKANGLAIKSLLRRKPNAQVKITWKTSSNSRDGHSHLTQTVKGSTEPLWEESFYLFNLTEDSTVSFEIIDKGYGPSHSYGVVTKTVKELLAMEKDRPGIVFPSSGALLSIRIDKEANPTAGDALKDASASTERFFRMPTDTNITTSAYTSLGDVVGSLEKLMGIADSIARVHPYINIAWKTVSSVYKVVKNQLDRDENICGLLQTMATIYSFVTPLETMRQSHQEVDASLVDVIKQILQQTVECSLFVQEYSGNGFAGRSIKHTFSTTDSKIQAFQQAFLDLGTSLDTGLGVQNALVTIRMAGDIEQLLLSETLKPATMNWSHRPTCHPRTRLNAMRTISDWIVDPTNTEKVLWITGVAGTGKSTLATTLANLYAETQRLGAFIFFDRDVKERSDPDNVLRTLAYELSRYDNRIARRVTQASRQYSRIAQMQLDAQFRDLIRVPLHAATSDSPDSDSLADEGPIVIVIDSLDECGHPSNRGKLLDLLAKETAQLPHIFRVLITSRNEPDINMAFSKAKHIKHFPLDSSHDDGDIRVYLESKLTEIGEKNYLDEGWPGDKQLDALARRAAGLFIWASTAVKYIDEYDPEGAVEDLLSGIGFHDGLDELYSKTLHAAGIWTKDQFRKDFQAIFGLVMVAKNPMSPNAIDDFLRIKSLRVLSRFGSVLHLGGPDDPVRILHKSFSEYIASAERCDQFNPDPRKYEKSPWLIDTPHHELQAASICLNLLQKTLVPPRRFVISEKVNPNYSEAVIYACSHWTQHAIAVQGGERAKMASTVYAFMKLHIMRWFEATSILDLSRSTPSMLEDLYIWASETGNKELTVLAYDAYRFASFFAETLAEHPAMVMQVALPFAPVESQIYKLFHDPKEYPTVMGGYTKQWAPSLRVFPILDTSVISAAFSPDTTKVVSTGAYFDDDSPINGDENNCVRCWDVATGTEAMPRVQLEFTSIARFSPDGTQVWVATGRGTVYVLAAGTGDRIAELRAKSWQKVGEESREGRPTSKSASRVPSRVPSRLGSRPPSAMRHALSLDSAVDPPPPYSADSAPNSPRPSSVPLDGSDRDDDDEFDPDLNFTRAAFSDNGKWVIFGDDPGSLFVVNRKTGRLAYPPLQCASLEWREVVRMFTSIAFSPDDTFFAVGSGDGTIHLWRTESGDEMAELEGQTQEITVVAFSPDGERVYSASEDGDVRIWNTSTYECISNVTIDTAAVPGYQPIAFASDGRLSSTSADGTIQIWDASTGAEVGPVLQGHFNSVSAMTFSNDGMKLVSGAFKNNIQTWDVSASGKTDLVRIPRHERPPHAVEFSPSGLLVRSSRPNETKFWCSMTGRELKMEPYDKSTTFLGDDGEKPSASDNEESPENVFKLDPADELVTSSGTRVVLLDSQPDAVQSSDQEQWYAAMKSSDPISLHWSYYKRESAIRYHHPSTITQDDENTHKYETDGKDIWRIPLEFRHRSNHLRPNFAAFGIWNGRVLVVHIPKKLIDRNAPSTTK